MRPPSLRERVEPANGTQLLVRLAHHAEELLGLLGPTLAHQPRGQVLAGTCCRGARAVRVEGIDRAPQVGLNGDGVPAAGRGNESTQPRQLGGQHREDQARRAVGDDGEQALGLVDVPSLEGGQDGGRPELHEVVAETGRHVGVLHGGAPQAGRLHQVSLGPPHHEAPVVDPGTHGLVVDPQVELGLVDQRLPLRGLQQDLQHEDDRIVDPSGSSPMPASTVSSSSHRPAVHSAIP